MANEYLLSEYADEAALQKQTAFILQSFDTIEAKAKNVGIALKDVFNNLNNNSTGTKQIIDDFKKMESAASDVVKVTKTGSEAIKQQNIALTETAKITKEVTASLQQNIETRRKLQNSMQSYLKDQKEDLALLKQGVIDRAEYNKRITESQIKVEQYKNRIADLDKVIKSQTATEAQRHKEVVANLSREEKLQKQVSETERNSLGRAQALILLYTEQKKKLNLATADGARLNDNYNKAIAKTNAFIKANADEVTKQAKNVGNYGSALNKILGPLRTAANILPGLGISGIILLLAEGIQSLLEYAQGITNASRAQRDFNASIETSKASVSGQIAVMQSLVAIAKDETQSNKTRQEAINKLNAEYSVFNKELSLSNINTDKATELINKQTAALVRQAQIKGLEGLITEETQKQAKMLTGDLDDNLTTLDKIKIALAGGIGGPTLTNSTRFNAGIESLNKNLKNSKERIDIFKKGLQELLLEDAKAGTLFDDNKGGKDDNKGGKGKQSAQLQALKEELNTEFEIYKIRQERKLKNFDDDIKSDKVHYLDKLTALKNYVEASQELIDKQEAEDIRKKKEAADREIKRLNEEKAGKNPQQIARINENIKIIEENLQQDILLIQAQAADKSVELSRNAAKVKEGILADQLKRERELYEEYAKYEQDVLNKTNDRYKKALEQRQKDEEAAAKKRLELEKDLQNRKVQLAEQAEQFLFKLGEASFTRQLNALRDLQDANEAKAAREIEILTEQERQGIITKEDAANQIAIIEARARIQKEQTEKKARDIEVNKAKFQRAQQIFEIGITAIKSVAAIKAQAAILLANPLTAALAPVALAQIPFVLGGAALGIAGILANPIPRFFKGKKKNEPYKGPALINDNPDGRTLEAITREDGTIEFPEGRNVLTHVNPGDVIHPDRDAFIRDLQRTALRSVANTANGKVTELAYVSAMTNALKGELQQNNKYLKQLVNKPAGDFHLHMQNNDYFNLKVNW